MPSLFFFFNDTATTEIYTLSLHDALPISDHVDGVEDEEDIDQALACPDEDVRGEEPPKRRRSEEHTSELQSQSNLVCRLLLEKKKKINTNCIHIQTKRSTDRTLHDSK